MHDVYIYQYWIQITVTGYFPKILIRHFITCILYRYRVRYNYERDQLFSCVERVLADSIDKRSKQSSEDMFHDEIIQEIKLKRVAGTIIQQFESLE